MLKAIIVDDEKNSREVLALMLQDLKGDVEVVDICDSPLKGIESVRSHKPDILFLDVDMPVMTGFEMLEKIPDVPVNVIFTTAHNHYALNAIRASALDFILKPVDPELLEAAVKKAKNKVAAEKIVEQYKIFSEHLNKKSDLSNRLALPTMDGLIFITIDDVVRCEADGNYTRVVLTNQEKLMITKVLNQFEEMLDEYGFIRIHHSHLINSKKIKRYVRGDGGYVVMADGSQVDVSRRKKQEFLDRLMKI